MQSNHLFGHLDLLKSLEYLDCYFQHHTLNMRGLLHQLWQQELKEGDLVIKEEIQKARVTDTERLQETGMTS